MTGRMRGILAVVCCSAAIFWPGALIFGFPGVMGPYWQEMFGVGRGAIGSIMFFVLAALGFFMFFVGRWQEKYGTRLMITIGAVICGLNLFIAAYASNLYMIYLWAFLNGTASSFIYIPALTSVQRWYVGKRGLVSGIVNLVFGMSAAVMVPVFSSMLKSMGYVSMIISIAIISLVVGITAAQFTETPERLNLTEEIKTKAEAKLPQQMAESLTVRESLKTRSFWFLWLTWALQGAAGIAMVGLSVIFGLAKGFTMESAVIILTVFNMMSGLSRILTGHLSDLVGRNLTMSLTFFAAGCAYLVLPHLNGLAALAALAGIIGFAFGTLFAVSAPLASDCFGLKHFGAIFGLVFTAYGFISGALGPSLSGYILDLTNGNFVIVFTYLGFFSLISGVLIRFVTVQPKSESWGQKAKSV
ncbi:MAG: MFS transporter [Bacillota bacterium]|nr:MFS transporter [Bacillota bacterium]